MRFSSMSYTHFTQICSWVIVADYRKKSLHLGTSWHAGVPIEVVPFGYMRCLTAIRALPSPNAILRMAGAAKAGPVVTDNGNFIVDAPVSAELYAEPRKVRDLCGDAYMLI